MALPGSLAYRDILWIVIPSIVLITLFSPLIGIYFTTNDIAIIGLMSVILGYIINDPLGWFADQFFMKFSDKTREFSDQLAEIAKEWDLERLWSGISAVEQSYLIELDAYAHMHKHLSIIFILYSVYNLGNLLLHGLCATTMILHFLFQSWPLGSLSILFAVFCYRTYLSYTETLVELHASLAKKYWKLCKKRNL